jgi:hypothetical protein
MPHPQCSKESRCLLPASVASSGLVRSPCFLLRRSPRPEVPLTIIVYGTILPSFTDDMVWCARKPETNVTHSRALSLGWFAPVAPIPGATPRAETVGATGPTVARRSDLAAACKIIDQARESAARSRKKAARPQ